MSEFLHTRNALTASDRAPDAWFEPGAVIPVGVEAVALLAREVVSLRAEIAALRADLALCRERDGATGLEYRGG